MFQSSVGGGFLRSQDGLETTGTSWSWDTGPFPALLPLPSMVSRADWLVPKLAPEVLGLYFQTSLKRERSSISCFSLKNSREASGLVWLGSQDSDSTQSPLCSQEEEVL